MDGLTVLPGNSQRKGSIRKTSKKPTAGSGGRVKRGLEGKGPTPRASEREYHKTYKKQTAAAKKTPSRKPRRKGSDAEWIAGRNSVLEALREGVPVNGLYVAEGAERDGRLREAFKLSQDRGIPLSEVSKVELDRLTDRAVHQGLAARIPAYEYAHPDDLLKAAAERGRSRSSWPVTRSPTRATWARWSAVRPASARTAWSSPSDVLLG